MLPPWPAYSWANRLIRQSRIWLSCLFLVSAGAQSHAASAMIFVSVVNVTSVMDMASVNAVSVSTRVPGVILIRFPSFAALVPAPSNNSSGRLEAGSAVPAAGLMDALQDAPRNDAPDALPSVSMDGLLRGDMAVSLSISSEQAPSQLPADGLSPVRSSIPRDADVAQSCRLTVVFN